MPKKKKRAYPPPEHLETGWAGMEHLETGWAPSPPGKELTTDNILSIEECEIYVDNVFFRVSKLHGEKEARRIFAEYSKPAKRAAKLNDDAFLLLHYLGLFLDVEGKPSVREYAVRVAKEKRVDPDAMERKVWRVLNDEGVWAYLAEEGYLHCPWPLPEPLRSTLTEDRREFLRLWGLLPINQ
jgi:hypothetical protein